MMPLARLRAAAAEAANLASRLGGDVSAAPAAEDLLAQQLLGWFKSDFFTWVSGKETINKRRCLVWGAPIVKLAVLATPPPALLRLLP